MQSSCQCGLQRQTAKQLLKIEENMQSVIQHFIDPDSARG